MSRHATRQGWFPDGSEPVSDVEDDREVPMPEPSESNEKDENNDD